MSNALDWVEAVGAVITPVVLAVFAFVVARRQDRNAELLRFRLENYRTIAPLLNRLMCYFTFIGHWKAFSPPDIVATKRDLDAQFACASPLFSEPVVDAYEAFMNDCFATFGAWGADARLRTSAFRRRPVHPRWHANWDDMFVIDDDRSISGDDLANLRRAYDKLVSAMVTDLNIARARAKYTTDLVSLNAHRQRPNDVPGGLDE